MQTFNLETIMTMDQEKIDSLNLMSKTNSVWVNKKELVLTGIYFVGKSKVIITEYPNTVKPYPYQLINDITGIKAKAFDLFALNHSEIADFIHIYLKNHGLFINFLDERKDNQELRQKNTELKESVEKLSKANKEVTYKYKKLKSRVKTISIKEIRKEIANSIKSENIDPEKLKLELEKLKVEFDERNEFCDFLKTKNKDTSELEKELILKLNKISELENSIEESEYENNFIQYHVKNEKLQEKIRSWKKELIEKGSWKK